MLELQGLITELIIPARDLFNRVASENVFRPLHPEIGASLYVKRVIAAADLLCIFSSASEMSLLNVITCNTSCWLVSQSFRRFSCCVETREHSAAHHCMSSLSTAKEDVDYEVFWLVSVIKVQFGSIVSSASASAF